MTGSGDASSEAFERLRLRLEARGVVFVDDREGASLEGAFHPRGGDVPLARLPSLLRSWELFDRVYEAVADVDAEALVAARLEGADLPDDESTAERLASGLLVFADGMVVALDVDAHRRVLARLARG